MGEQVPGVFVTPPSVEGRLIVGDTRRILGVKFRIWPDRGGPIATGLKSEIGESLKNVDDRYSDRMVTINHEAEKKIGRSDAQR